MRKLVLIAAALALVALMLLLARGLISPAAPALEPDPAAQSGSSTRAGDLEETAAEESARSALAEPQRAPQATPGALPAGTCALLIRVEFARAPGRQPRKLEVRVSDMLGVQRDAHRESPLEFLVTGIAPGDYVVAASEASSIGATQRARVSAPGEQKVVVLVLEPMTVLTVHWRAPDGRAIESALLDAPVQPGRLSFIAFASREPIRQDGPRPTSVALASIQKEVLVARDESTTQLVQIGLPRDEPRPLPARTDDVFGKLEVAVQPPLWVSAWVCGILLDSQLVTADQRDVVFTTRLEDLVPPTASISFCLVDDSTEQPVTAARVTIAGQTHWMGAEEGGCSTIQVQPGWALVRIEPDSPSEPDRAPSSFAPIAFQVQTMIGRPLDLGRIRLSPPRSARFGVVDGNGRGVTAAEFTLVRLASYDGTGAPPDLQRAWSDASGIVAFHLVARERYVLTCTSPRIDCRPVVFDGARISVETGALVDTLVMQTVRQISLAFDEPPPAGTLVMIETQDGLPVRQIEVDEFGIVPLWLSGTDYKFHLVVEGEKSESQRFSVTSDPFVLEIGR